MICATCKNSVRCRQAVYVVVYVCPAFEVEPEFEEDIPEEYRCVKCGEETHIPAKNGKPECIACRGEDSC